MRWEFLRGDTALDTSVLVEIALATREGRFLVKLIVDETVTPYTTSLNVTEALYVLCRVLGFEEAERRMNLILDSGYFNVVSSERLSKLVAQCKCVFPVSIADCYTLALAKQYSIPALFYKPEKELQPILEKVKEWIGNEILFLAEYLR
ncbi:MAG: PIN domain-containing protein [Thermofilaceae archaeon]